MIVGSQSRFFQPSGLRLGQHPERAANFHPQRRNAAHHFEHVLEFPALGSVSPGRAHAEARHAAARRLSRHFDDVLRVQQSLPLHTRVIMRALRAIGAIFRAPSCLDGNQLAGLHAVRSMVPPMNRLRPEHQLRQRHPVNLLDFSPRPIVPHPRCCRITQAKVFRRGAPQCGALGGIQTCFSRHGLHLPEPRTKLGRLFWECGGLPPLFFRTELDPMFCAPLLCCPFRMKPASYHQLARNAPLSYCAVAAALNQAARFAESSPLPTARRLTRLPQNVIKLRLVLALAPSLAGAPPAVSRGNSDRRGGLLPVE